MNRIRLFVAVGTLLGFQSALVAQQPDFPTPTKEHQWLQKFVGEWVSVGEATMGPDQPPMKSEGSMSNEMLGGFWVINKMKSEFQGTTVTGIQTIGYDPAKQKYVGTWVDSFSDFIWSYEGAIDESSTKLTLDADGPSFSGDGTTAKYRDAYEFKSDDHIIATSSMQSEDGTWVTFMTSDIRRKK